MARIGIVGSGVAGLGAAYRLAPHAQVTLFEAEDRFGGHAHTVDVTLDGHTHAVDIAFLTCNLRTYPLLFALFEELGVEVTPSPLSFSVRLADADLEWRGPTLNGLFAQRRNIVSPRFWRMLADVMRFNRLATELATSGGDRELAQSTGDFLRQHSFGSLFLDAYFLPIVGSLWLCPTGQALEFPIGTLVSYFHNHGLIDMSSRHPWCSVTGGSQRYVEKIIAAMRKAGARALSGTPVLSVRRHSQGVTVRTRRGEERFDHIVFACHADQALALLADPGTEETSVLGAFRFHSNRAVLHTDAAAMPRRLRSWAALNYLGGKEASGDDGGSCVHFWLNALQPLPFRKPLFVSINPMERLDPACMIGQFELAHPMLDLAAVQAQRQLSALQGGQHTWFCGAWTGYGFHEDGLRSGQAVAEQLLARFEGGHASDASSRADHRRSEDSLTLD